MNQPMVKNQFKNLVTKSHQFNNLSVLIIDTIDSMRNAAAAMLNEIGFAKVYQSHNGADALKILSRAKVDLILSEWQVGRMDGIELLRKVREDAKTANIPFIIASATVEHEEVVRAIKSGVSEYVAKPYSPKILEDRIARALKNPVKQFNTKSASSSATKVKKEPLKILVVDDVPDNIHLITELLKGEYKIRAATDGEKALTICASNNPPDIVLLDIMMPGMNGLEVCKRLKANPATEFITVIFLTALDQTKHIVKGFELGAVDYITKPINPPVVKARIKTHSKVVNAQKLLHTQIDTLVENERMKMEFDRIMQNDLKQPIAEVFKSVQQIERYSKDSAKVKQFCESVSLSCNNMQQIIDNMLMLTKLEEGDYHLVPTKMDLHAIISKVMDSYVASYSEKKLEVHYEFPNACIALGEELLTVSLFSNVIKNAIEAAPRGSAITFTEAVEKGFQVVKIHNHGAIPIEIIDNFFDKYVTSGKKGGTGIGTYAAKLLTEVQKGVIEFETSEQDGTTMMIALPVPA